MRVGAALLRSWVINAGYELSGRVCSNAHAGLGRSKGPEGGAVCLSGVQGIIKRLGIRRRPRFGLQPGTKVGGTGKPNRLGTAGAGNWELKGTNKRPLQAEGGW